MTNLTTQEYAKRIRMVEKNKSTALLAFELYKTWMRINRRKPPTKLDVFIKSWGFKRFMSLVKFFEQVEMNNPELYMTVMKNHKVNINAWTRNSVYRLYLNHMDNNESPETMIKNMMEYLFDLSARLNIPVKDVINELPAGTIVQLLQQRKFTPWVVLNSDTMITKILEADDVHQKLLGDIIKFDEWKIKMHEDSDALILAKNIVSELEI